MSDDSNRMIVGSGGARPEHEPETLQHQLVQARWQAMQNERRAIFAENALNSLRLASSPDAIEAARIIDAAKAVNAATFSHVDGRDLLAELHPRKTLDIKRRVDGVERWFEGDWLSDVYRAIQPLREALRSTTHKGGA